jgi:16S rRNA (cytidine1402-2'-O)-methyltransferase
LLKHLGIQKPLTRFDDNAGKREASALAGLLAAGKTVAYCSDAGTPGINDPGFELARLARASGAEVLPLPGPSVVTLAVVASGLPTHTFSFLGYLPSRAEARRAFVRRLAGREETIVVFETPHRIGDALQDMQEIMPDREIALGRELTKLHEAMYRGTPSQVLDQPGAERRGEMVLVVAGAGAKSVLGGAARGPGDSGPDSPPQAALPGWAARFLDAAREGGMTLREAAKPLARRLGMEPSDVYRMASQRPGASAEDAECSSSLSD